MSRPDSPDIPDSPSRIHRALSLDAYFASESNLPELDQPDEDHLSEEQLRELYDNEEIDRFLGLFSDFVTEVQVPETPSPTALTTASRTDFFGDQSSDTYPTQTQTSEDGEWTPLRDEEGNILSKPTASIPSTYHSLSEEIAYRYLVPILPRPRPSLPAFTIGHLRLATQRTYLATLPVYGPFASRLIKLATWEDQRTSLVYCCIFWSLWWNNLLAPALVLRILYSLFNKRFLPYPSLDELRRHREEVERAGEFGEQISARLNAKGSGMIEIWRIIKLLDLKKKKAKKGMKQAKAKVNSNLAEEDNISIASQEQEETILDNMDDGEDARDLKQIGLHVLEEIADVHERVRNIFIWRRPSASRMYGGILFGIFLFTLCPTKYIVKLITFTLGFTFWHLVPVIAALPSAERQRLPPLFSNVPTDADFAMELISQRIANGLEIRPKRAQKRSKKDSDSIHSFESGGKHNKGSQSLSQPGEKSIDWKKWGDRVAIGKSAMSDIKRLKPGNSWPVHDVWPPRHPIIPGVVGMAQPQLNVETHTYPCQHSSAPGLITLTQTALFFTPLMSQNAKVTVPLTAVKGIKKTGLLKGLTIRWNDTVDGNKEQKEDKFLWVGGRDELFARLVGNDSTRWMKV